VKKKSKERAATIGPDDRPAATSDHRQYLDPDQKHDGDVGGTEKVA
jgi:hypothetical protein